MNAGFYAQELARRLNETDVARFRAAEETVILDGPGFYKPLRVVDAGSGRTEQVERAMAQAAAWSETPVVVGRHFSGAALRVLDSAGANYMDDRHIRVRMMTPDILIRLTDAAEPLPEPRTSPLVLAGAAGGVALALLGETLREWKVTDAAAGAKVSLGTAQSVLVALESEGLARRVGTGPATTRRLTDPGGLLDRYARDAAADRKVLARAYVLDDGPEQTMRTVCERLSAADLSAAFTGVGAAHLLAPHLSAIRHYELWVTSPHRADHWLKSMDASSVTEGANLVLLRGPRSTLVGSERDNGIRRASVFRIYADCLQDPARGEEQAEHLRDTVIGF
jgi:hypothetical protein